MHGEDHEGPDPTGDPWGDDDGPQRGWLPPDDRLWRHPSERAAGAPAGATGATASGAVAPRGPRIRRGRGRSLLIGAGAGALTAACMAAGFAIAAANAPDQAAAPPAPPAAPRLTQSTHLASMAAVVTGSTVALVVTTAHGTRTGSGLVVEAGGIVATTAGLLDGARRIEAVDAAGDRWAAEVVGRDAGSQVAAVRIPVDLPVAPVTARAPQPGAAAVVLAAPATTRAPGGTGPRLAAATVVAPGPGAPARTLPTAAAATAAAPGGPGSVLVDGAGRAAGLLEQSAPTALGQRSTFVPAGLARAVAAQLVRSGSVRTGTLGVAVVDAAPGSADAPGGGARIVRVVAGGAAEAAGLAPDDVVTAVDGAPVGSAEGLAGALYAHPPGTACTLTVDRDGVTLVTGATLGS